MSRVGALLVLAGCGRIGFDPRPSADDAQPIDAPADAWFGNLTTVTNGPRTDVVMGLDSLPTGYAVTGALEAGAGLGASIPVNQGAADAFVAVLDSVGQLRWLKTCASAGEDLAQTATADASGNIYVGGGGFGPIDCGGGPLADGPGYSPFLVSYTPDGQYRWSASIPSSDPDPGALIDAISSVKIINGQLVVAGYVHGSVTFGTTTSPALQGPYDGFIAFYTLDGQFVSHRRFPSALIGSLVFDASSMYVVAQLNGGPTNFGGASLPGDSVIGAFDLQAQHRWSRSLGSGVDMGGIVLRNARLDVTGSFSGSMTVGNTITSAGSKDVYVASFTTDDQPLRAIAIGGADCDEGGALMWFESTLVLAMASSGSFTYGGTSVTSRGGIDGYVLTMDENGTPGSLKQFGDTLDDYVGAVVTTPSGVFYGGATNLGPASTGCNGHFFFDERDLLLGELVLR